MSQIPNLHQFLDAYVQFQRSNLAGFVTDEFGDSAEIDRLLQNLAERLVQFSARGYVKPPTFLGVGGDKVIQNAIWNARIVFQADYKAYRELGLYDSSEGIKTRLTNGMLTLLLKTRGFRKEFRARMKDEMLKPYQKISQ